MEVSYECKEPRLQKNSAENENAPVKRGVDKKLEYILRANFSEEELGTRFCEGDQPVEEGKGKVVDDVSRYFERLNNKVHS